MSKVFLAYKTVDADRANKVREKLEALDVPLFIDQKLKSGDNYIATINNELDVAVAVLVLWTNAAVRLPGPGEQPNFVLSEAERGFNRAVLVAATLDRLLLNRLPVPFNLFQAPDLSDWIEAGGPARHQGWQRVLQALGEKLDRKGLPDLAVAIESDDDLVKQKFLRDYPNDPLTGLIAAQLESAVRSEFEARISAAEDRIRKRAKEADAKLKSCREEFDSHIIELRAGRNYMPPDPLNAIDDNVAKLANEIEIYKDAAEQLRGRAERAESESVRTAVEAAGLKTQIEKTAVDTASDKDEITTLNGRLAELQASVASLKQRIQGEARRLATWCGLTALIGAGIFGTGGWISGNHSDTTGIALQTQVYDLTTQAAGWQNRFEDLKRQSDDIRRREDAVAAESRRLSDFQADLSKQTTNLKMQQDALAAKQPALAKLQESVASQQADLNKQTAAVKAQQDALQSKQGALAAEHDALTRQQMAIASVPLVAQCDALTGYEYDQDRPPNSGWVESSKDIPSGAQTICQSALQTIVNDPKTQRRIMLQLGRTIQEKSRDTALEFQKQSAVLGSSHARYLIAGYYADHNNPSFNPRTAWDALKQSADSEPGDPLALYSVAYTLLFPSDRDKRFAPAQADLTEAQGEIYLRKAINADYPAAYYIAGVYYLRKGKNEWDKERQNREVQLGTQYLIASWCAKKYRDPDGYDARKYLSSGDLSCQ